MCGDSIFQRELGVSGSKNSGRLSTDEGHDCQGDTPLLKVSCLHENTITDEHEGTVVCTQCGLVLENQIFAGTDFPQHQANTTITIDEDMQQDQSKKMPSDDKLWMLLTDWSWNGHIAPIYIEDAFSLYVDIKHRKKSKQSEQHINSTTNESSVLAICLYEVLKRGGISRSLREVSGITGHSVRTLTQKLKQHFPQSRPIPPAQMVSRFCKRLGLSSTHTMTIEQEVAKLSHTNSFNPATLIAAEIIIHEKYWALGLTNQQICNTIGISPVAVRRYLKRRNSTNNQINSDKIHV